MPETENIRKRLIDLSSIPDDSKEMSLSQIMKRRAKASRMISRRVTYGFEEVAGLKYDLKAPNHKRQIRTSLNTYQLEPRKVFDCDKVTDVINEILKKFLDEHIYNEKISPGLAIQIASEIRRRIKQEGQRRYRLISVVTIGQNLAQSYNNAVAFLWDHVRDTYVNVNRKVFSGFCQVTVFAVYLD